MTKVALEELTAESFATFGSIVDRPPRRHDADGPGWQWWAETCPLRSDGRPWVVGYLDLAPTEPRFDWAERHLFTQEVVLAGSSDIAVYVARPVIGEPDRLPELDTFRAFRVAAGRGIVMEPGVWHGAPFSLQGACNALVLLLEGTGRRDVTVVRFTDTPVDIEVPS